MFFTNFKTRKQLYKEIEELKASKNKYFDKYTDLYLEYNQYKASIKKISASCISWEDKGDYSVSKECICYELAKQLMPYIKFEHYKIADGSQPDEMKHFGTIQVIGNMEDV